MFAASILALCAPLALPSAPRAHSPHDVIAAWAISPDFSRDQTLFVSLPRFNLLLRSRDGGLNFEVVNTGLHLAHVVALAISPDYARDGTLFCSELEHVSVTVDAGLHWRRLTLPEGLNPVRGIAVSPDFAADGTLALESGKAGLWLSRDRGESWSSSALPAPEPDSSDAARAVRSLVFSPDFARDRRAWALLDGRALIFSSDGANTFLELASPAGGELQALAVDPSADTLWLGTSSRGVLVSADGGASWKAEGSETAGMNVSHLALARDAKGRAVLFASTAEDGVLVKAGGESWRANKTGFRENSDQTTHHYHGTMPSPDFARDQRVYAATFEGLYVSRAGGDGWEWLDVLQKHIVRNLSLSSQFAEDGTFWLSTYGMGLLELEPKKPDAKEARAASRSPLPLSAESPAFVCRQLETHGWLFPDGIAVAPTPGRPRTIMVGTPGHLLYSTDGGEEVRVAIEAEIGFSRALAFAPDFAHSGLAFANLNTYTGTKPLERRFARSADRGLTWGESNIDDVDDMAFACDWQQSGRMYAAGSQGLWISRDRGLNFERVAALSARQLDSVAVAAGSPGPGGAGAAAVPDILLVASRSHGIHLSRDGGANWRALAGGIQGVACRSVELSPDFARDGLAFAGSPANGVHVTRDGGESWSPSEGGARAVLAMDRSPSFARDRTLLVGSYDGAWISRDAAATWTRLEIPEPEPDGARRRWKWIAGVAGVVALAGALALRRRRRGASES